MVQLVKSASRLCRLVVAVGLLAQVPASWAGESVASRASSGEEGSGLAPRIVNGVLTGEYPSVGLLLCQKICTATLIGCDTILTAAHCVCGFSDEDATGADCQAGGSQLEDPANCDVFFQHAPGDMGDTPVFFGVSSITVHPDYLGVIGNDLAILKLSTPVTGIRPSAINTSGTPAPGTVGTIVGFGDTDGDADDTGIKRTGKVTTSMCIPASDAHVCWSFTSPIGQPGEDSTTCQGDSGGPLFVDIGGDAVLAGVTSFGAAGCGADAIISDFDSDVFDSRDWIASVAGADLGTEACGSTAQAGEAGTTISAFSGVMTPADPTARHQVEVPPATDLLRVSLNARAPSDSAGNNCDGLVDYDLYVRAGSPPTEELYDCRPFLGGAREFCEFENPAPGTWHVLVNRFCGSGEYQVTATTLGAPVPTDPCAAPETGCRTAARSQFAIGGGKLNWKWGNGAATSQAEFADPTSSAEYKLCIHEASAPAGSASVPPSGTKWSAIGAKGYKYQDKGGGADGITKMIVKGGGAGKAMALVKGQGGNLPDPDFPLELPVTVQLLNLESGVCWETTFNAGDVKKNDAGKFQAKR